MLPAPPLSFSHLPSCIQCGFRLTLSGECCGSREGSEDKFEPCPKELPECFTQLLRPHGLPGAAHVVQARTSRHLGRPQALEEQDRVDPSGGGIASAQRSWDTEKLGSFAVGKEGSQETGHT